MKRGMMFVLGAVLLAGLALLFGRPFIAEQAFRRALDTNVGVDQSAAFADLCGAGNVRSGIRERL